MIEKNLIRVEFTLTKWNLILQLTPKIYSENYPFNQKTIAVVQARPKACLFPGSFQVDIVLRITLQ